jgi:NitT/TauT family transport system permease protein
LVGEFQSANLGLGYLIQYSSQSFKLNIVMTAITVWGLYHPSNSHFGILRL